ncbi:sensor domain-containing diguanylate cyclase [Desulfovibrio sp.]|uniref:sensor domain-containing diguanylate cyclase n=1 Tax=Desulfovibrio sp. TaxID=885 RepID=UPI0023BF94A5|nr:sensor domain-containing diguanylate cyclase [Desulfovibrio sp.]MDE7242226.1 sensor domain-containing diguanylate cyclase [Desulfovibrio sp.]
MRSRVVKTNLLVGFILLIGFSLTAFFSHSANYRVSLTALEQVAALTADSIYFRLSSVLNRPVTIALTMAGDTFLADYLLREGAHLEEAEFARAIQSYLAAYQEKNHFDSVFLVSAASRRYYSAGGIDRALAPDDPKNAWYSALMSSERQYSLNVDTDKAAGAVFVNCKIMDPWGEALGVVGIGIRTASLKHILKEYEERYGVEVFLLDSAGRVELSRALAGEEGKNWFTLNDSEKLRADILGRRNSDENFGLWAGAGPEGAESAYLVTRYMPELSWYLLVKQNTAELVGKMKSQIRTSVLVLLLILASVFTVITLVIRGFNKKITGVIEQRLGLFKQATEQLYDDIYEWNITRNRCVGKNTEEYFARIGASRLSFDEGLRIIAEKQIKPEFREGYIAHFSTKNVLREFARGNQHLRYDFMITQDGKTYHWMRIDAHVFYSPDDDSLHMFTYRKNIDVEKQKEALANMDEMTKCYNKKATERMIDDALAHHPGSEFAFFIFDIDNFKHANDTFGHAFGDLCIREFSATIRKHFREDDIVGRIGGDEFVAFIPIPSRDWAEQKARELVGALDFVCADGEAAWRVSASIGVAFAPMDGTRFIELYQSADAALYETKQNGKNNFTISKSREDQPQGRKG